MYQFTCSGTDNDESERSLHPCDNTTYGIGLKKHLIVDKVDYTRTRERAFLFVFHLIR